MTTPPEKPDTPESFASTMQEWMSNMLAERKSSAPGLVAYMELMLAATNLVAGKMKARGEERDAALARAEAMPGREEGVEAVKAARLRFSIPECEAATALLYMNIGLLHGPDEANRIFAAYLPSKG